MFSRNRLLIQAVLVLAMSAPAVVAAEDGDWLLRFGVHQINPDKNNLPDTFGGNVVFDKEEAITLDAEYMLTPHIGVDLFVPSFTSHEIHSRTQASAMPRRSARRICSRRSSVSTGTSTSTDRSGRISASGPTGRTSATRSSLATACCPSGSRLEIDQAFGLAGRAGVDIGTSEHWFLNLDARYVDLQTDVEARVPSGLGFTDVPAGEANIDPWIYGIAIGYRFGAEKPLPEPVAEEPPPPPPPPPPPEKCADGDNDGVCDTDDKCPATPAGTRVDRVGCPLSQTVKVLFDFDSAELRPESITELERLVKLMNDVPFATALIEGHTDSVGADAYNLALSDRRAKSVFDYLTSRGVDPARLKSIGKGESEPVAENTTEEGRQENRRVLLIRTDTGT